MAGAEEQIPPDTIQSADGRVLMFGCDQFIEDICIGDRCFICGASPTSKKFNGEHVIPDWLLKRFDLTDRVIVLSNGDIRTYGSYKMPCCKDCNGFLGAHLETPVSKLLSGTFEEIVARLDQDAITLISTWLSLIFLKTHLKDRSVPLDKDERLKTGWLADQYFWPEMHHLHCLARAPYTKAEIDPRVFGSLLLFKVEDDAVDDEFDFGDLTEGQTVVLRIGDCGLVSVLNDSGAAALACSEKIGRIDASISAVQLRELGAMLATVNTCLLSRPEFGTSVSVSSETVRIWVRYADPPLFAPFDLAKFGQFLAFSLRDAIDHLPTGRRSSGEFMDQIRAGDVTFLWDGAGQFIRPE